MSDLFKLPFTIEPGEYPEPDTVLDARNKPVPLQWLCDRLNTPTAPSEDVVKAAEEFKALADRAAVEFPEDLRIQSAACALLGIWALRNRALISSTLASHLPSPATAGDWVWQRSVMEAENAAIEAGLGAYSATSDSHSKNVANVVRAALAAYRSTIPSPQSPAPSGLTDDEHMVLGEALWRAVTQATLFQTQVNNAELWRHVGKLAETSFNRLTTPNGTEK